MRGQIDALARAGQDVTTRIDELIAAQNRDGGWGSRTYYVSNPTDTSFVLKALAAANYNDSDVLARAIAYLKTTQHEDGGWGSSDGESFLEPTANVLSVFNILRESHDLEEQLTKGLAWLIQRQNADYGFGNSPSTIYDTARAILTLKEFEVSPDIISHAVNYILDLQSEDGSWYGSPYQTALAVRAVRTATIEPDLSVKAANVTITPASITRLPSSLEIHAAIWNLGQTDAPDVHIALYDGAVSEENKLEEQMIVCPGRSATTVTFSVTITDGEARTFYIAADPDNLVSESNELNNTAIKAMIPTSTYDFEILPADVAVSEPSVDFFEEVQISSRITNSGTMNAYNVPVRYYVDEPQGAFELATQTIDIPAGATIDLQVLWKANKIGNNFPITVQVDPFDAFEELSETNNQASDTAHRE